MPIKELASITTHPELLGVSDTQASRRPTRLTCPPKFRSEEVWRKMFDSAAFVLGLKASESPWDFAIRTYLKACSTLGYEPFQDQGDRTVNTRIIEFLRVQRREIVKYLDKTGLLAKYKLSTPERGYTFKTQGFTLVARAVLTKIHSVADFEDAIKDVGFTRTGDGRWHKVLSACTRIHMHCRNSHRAIISYEIRVHSSPSIPLKKLTRIKANNWVSNNLWLPVVRTNRFRTLRNRSSLF